MYVLSFACAKSLCSFALMQKNQKIKAAEKMAKIYSFGYSEKSLTMTTRTITILLFDLSCKSLFKIFRCL